jgi:hypothetical protein
MLNEIENIVRYLAVMLLLLAAGFGGMILVKKSVESRHHIQVQSTPAPEPEQPRIY